MKEPIHDRVHFPYVKWARKSREVSMQSHCEVRQLNKALPGSVHLQLVLTSFDVLGGERLLRHVGAGGSESARFSGES